MAILGIDEVGRGPWAGPLVIGAVILPDKKPEWVDDLNDSKKLTAKKREKLNEIILKEATTGLGWVSSEELDEIGLSNALKLAARRAVEEVQKKHTPFNEIIIDGTINFLQGTKLEKYVTMLPKADFLIKEVSAASIIAKVARDNYMCELAKKYPEYGFEKHVGYGTAAHKKALDIHGACSEHRKSFKPIQAIIEKHPCAENKTGKELNLNKKQKTTKQKGDKGESVVAGYLMANGHEIIARNFKTKYCEIDIVSAKDEKIYFTEVKYRKNSTHGTPLDAITKNKQKQMKFAAEIFLKSYPETKNYQPILAAASVGGTDYEIEEWFTI